MIFNNGNWTEGSAIWSEIKLVILKSICNLKYDFRPKLHDMKFWYFITLAFLKLETRGHSYVIYNNIG